MSYRTLALSLVLYWLLPRPAESVSAVVRPESRAKNGTGKGRVGDGCPAMHAQAHGVNLVSDREQRPLVFVNFLCKGDKEVLV